MEFERISDLDWLSAGVITLALIGKGVFQVVTTLSYDSLGN